MAIDHFRLVLSGSEGLEKKLQAMNDIRWAAVVKKSATQMFNRAKGTDPHSGGTPKDSGEMRKTVKKLEDGIAYTVEYALRICDAYKTGQKRRTLSLRVA